MTSNENAVMSRLTATIEALWSRIAQEHPDVPPVVVTIAAGKLDANGHYAAARWNHYGARLSELFLSGESLKRGARATLVTVVHEAAHGANDTREMKDTSRQGRYHNDKFRKTAEEFGLVCTKDAKFGWLTSGSDATDELCEKYEDELEALEEALEDFYRLPEGHALEGGEEGEEEAKEDGQVSCVCQCTETARGAKTAPGPRRIRLSRSVLDLGGISCELCGALFEPEAK